MIIAEKEIKLFETNDKTIKEIIASMSMMNGEIELKVGKDGIISAINQSAEKIKINAEMIDLDGYVTISSLSGNGTTTIDGSNIKTGLISADRLDIDSIFAKDITASGSISGVTLNGATGSFTGKIEAGTGKIGGFDISDTGLHSGTESLTSKKVGVYVGIDGIRNVGSHGTIDITDGWIGFDKMYFNGGNNNTDVAIEGWSNAQDAIKRFQIKLNGDAIFRSIKTLKYDIESGRNIIAGGNFCMNNGNALLGKDTSDRDINLLNVSDHDNVVVGYGGSKSTNIYGGYAIQFLFKNLQDENGYIRWRPYYATGDSIKLHWDGAGYITNDGTYVKFTIPLSRPILMNPSVKVTNVNGLKIRQNGKYLYGSSATAGTKKVTYEASANKEWVRITAIMQIGDANTINNASCGIDADIEITFNE